MNKPYGGCNSNMALKRNGTFYLLLLDGFKDLDNTFIVTGAMNALENLAVFPPADLPHNFIVILLPIRPINTHIIH